MVAIAEKLRGPRSRLEFVFDRPQVLGSAFLAPAILYVLLLVGIPFLLAVYYALSAYTVYNPTYHFVGLQNFITVVQSEIFRRIVEGGGPQLGARRCIDELRFRTDLIAGASCASRKQKTRLELPTGLAGSQIRIGEACHRAGPDGGDAVDACQPVAKDVSDGQRELFVQLARSRSAKGQYRNGAAVDGRGGGRGQRRLLRGRRFAVNRDEGDRGNEQQCNRCPYI